jgi:oligoribonuclease
VSALDPATDRLVWLDLETTGLIPERDVVLEYACLVTDPELVPVDEGVSAVVHLPATGIPEMADHVREMHTRSGLLDEVAASATTPQEARSAVLEYIRGHVPLGSAPMAGSSIRFDRQFLARHAPEIDEACHYRIVDVSTVKELTRRWYPLVYRQLPPIYRAHRAMVDVHASIRELSFYRAHVFTHPLPAMA